MTRFAPPYLGAAYYPEAWPREIVEEDIRLMREAGLNAVRIGEFAWSSIEPREGQYELDWLYRVVDKLGDAGIATIMCTPSCTPPAWLTERYTEVVVVNPSGDRADHGFRRHVCPNNRVYRDHCARIATLLGESFGRDPRVIGWQIDNEVDLWNEWGCYCDICVAAFRKSLQERFHSIDSLNEAWGTNLWSQTYQSFGQIPAPRPEHRHHPSLLSAWVRFQGDSLVEYVAHQADVLHRCVSQPVGTDMMPFLSVPYEKMHRRLDLVQYNHYDLMDNLWRQVFWMDLVRPVKDTPFWNTETQTCWNGGTFANGYKEPGFCRVNSWLPIALGAEANLYWLWRAHWSGQELMHGSVVSSHGRPLHMAEEVKEVSRGFRRAAAFLNGTRPSPPGLAVHVSTLAWAQLRFQPLVEGFDYVDFLLHRVCRPLMDVHLRADMIDPSADLEPYRVVFTPFLPALDESGLRERLRPWIEAGGTWVVGPLSDIRTLDAAKHRDAPFGCLEDWAGVHCSVELPGTGCEFNIRWSDGRISPGSLWYAGLELREAHAIATYAEEPLAGLAAITEARLGKGRIVLLGTLPSCRDLGQLMVRQAARHGIQPVAVASTNVLVVPREGEAGRGFIVLELENRPGTIVLPEAVRDLLSGVKPRGETEIAPYQVLVFQQEATVEAGAVSSASA